MKVTKINRVLSFIQKPWMKSYIDLNTNLRKKCKSDFEKDFFKLMNNSVFGKTMENVRNRINYDLISDTKRLNFRVCDYKFKNITVYNENLVGVERYKTNVLLDKPIYCGFAILDLSKVLMYNFHYNNMKSKYGNKCKLLFTDTDSLCYSIETEDIYADMFEEADEYDFSGYNKEHKLFDEVNKKVIGKMKDECGGKIMTEFIGIRSKMYSYQVEDECKKKGKGVKTHILENALRMEHYRNCILDEKVYKCAYNNIGSNKHEMFTQVNNKVALNPFDDKRYLLNSIDSISHGHYKILC